MRDELIRQRESFVMETVFSDPVGDKLGFLREAARELSHVWVFDNDDLRRPFRLAAVCEAGRVARMEKPVRPDLGEAGKPVSDHLPTEFRWMQRRDAQVKLCQYSRQRKN